MGIVNVTVADVTPAVGAVRSPFRNCQSAGAPSGAPVGYNPIQSPGLPGPFGIVTVTVPPGPIVVGAAVTPRVGPVLCTVTSALVARTLYVLFGKNRTWYWPAVAGIVKVSVAELSPVDGAVRSPFRNAQSTYA